MRIGNALVIVSLFLAALSASLSVAVEDGYDLTSQYTTNVRINDLNGIESALPAIAAADDGTVYVVWEDKRNGNPDIYLSASHDAGQSFGSDVRVSDDQTSGWQVASSVAVGGDGKIHVIWSDWRNDADGKFASGGGVDGKNDCDVYYANSTDGGKTFNPNVRVNSDQNEWFQVTQRKSIAVDSEDRVHVVWSGPVDGDWTHREAFHAKSEDGGISFSPGEVISSSNMTVAYPSVSIGDLDEVYVVWADQRNRTSSWDIYLSRSMDKGSSFQTELKVNDDNLVNVTQEWPSISSRAGFVAIAWQDERESSLDVYSTVSDDGGVSFQSNTKVNDAALAPQYYPSVVMDDKGLISVAWRDKRNGHSDIYSANSSDFGNSFGIDSRVNDDLGTANQYSPDLASDENGYIYVAWMDFRNGIWDIYSARAPESIADLMVASTDISFIPTSPVSYGTTVDVGIAIHNVGSQDAINVVARFFDGLPASGSVVGQDVIPFIGRGGGVGSSHIGWVAVLPESHEICVVVDPTNNITESNESNNMACKTIEVVVPPLPDLTISPADILFHQAPPYVNGSFVGVNVTVHNIGNSNATNVTIRFMDVPYGQIESDKNIPIVPINGEGVVNVTWHASSIGDHEICVIADPENRTAELDETNNDACVLVEVLDASAPLPPHGLVAVLGGRGLENVSLSWTVSPDDGGGKDTVVRYDIFRGNSYDSEGLTYLLRDTLLPGTSSYVDVRSGEGDPASYFYLVCAVNAINNSSCSLRQAGKFTHPLLQGPNLVSTPIVQLNESVETVFQTVKYDKAWFYNSSSQEWKWFMKSKEYRRGLWNINHTMGTWVNCTRNSNLTVAGIVPTQTTIHLYEGWNLMSYPSFNTSYTVYDLKMDTGAIRVEGYDLSHPYHLRVLGDGEVLQAGLGYWVRVEADAVWAVDID